MLMENVFGSFSSIGFLYVVSYHTQHHLSISIRTEKFVFLNQIRFGSDDRASHFRDFMKKFRRVDTSVVEHFILSIFFIYPRNSNGNKQKKNGGGNFEKIYVRIFVV